MKRFSFSLAKLLSYREQLLETERGVLADMNAALARMTEELEEIKRQQELRAVELRERTARGISAMEMETHKNYLTMLDFSEQQKRRQISLQRQAIDRQTDRVREAKMEVSTLEKLRERKREEYDYLARKEEELLIEEFVSHSRAAAQ